MHGMYKVCGVCVLYIGDDREKFYIHSILVKLFVCIFFFIYWSEILTALWCNRIWCAQKANAQRCKEKIKKTFSI